MQNKIRFLKSIIYENYCNDFLLCVRPNCTLGLPTENRFANSQLLTCDNENTVFNSEFAEDTKPQYHGNLVLLLLFRPWFHLQFKLYWYIWVVSFLFDLERKKSSWIRMRNSVETWLTSITAPLQQAYAKKTDKKSDQGKSGPRI